MIASVFWFLQQNARLTALTREAAGGRALVAGDLSTLGQPLEPLGSLSYSEAYDIYREHMEALSMAGMPALGLATTGMSTASRMERTTASSWSGPTEQLTPTAAAPISWRATPAYIRALRQRLPPTDGQSGGFAAEGSF